MRRAATVAPVLAMALGAMTCGFGSGGAADRTGSSKRGSNRAGGTGVRLRRSPVDRNGHVGQRARRPRPRCGTGFASRTERLERGPLVPSGSSICLPSRNQNLTMDRNRPVLACVGTSRPVSVDVVETEENLDTGSDACPAPDGLLEPQTDVGKTDNQILPVMSRQTRKEPKK